MPAPIVIAIAEGIAAALGGAAAMTGAHQVLPGKEGREQSLKALGNALTGEAAQNEAAMMEKAEKSADETSIPGDIIDTCTNCRPPGPDCRFDKHKDLQCEGDEKRHHIVADYVVRAGKRMDSSLRLPNAPSLDEGISICIDDARHLDVHREMDNAIKALGPNGTLGDAKEIALKAIEKVKPECKGKMQGMRSQVNEAFEKMGDSAPVRTQKSPLPSGKILKNLLNDGRKLR